MKADEAKLYIGRIVRVYGKRVSDDTYGRLVRLQDSSAVIFDDTYAENVLTIALDKIEALEVVPYPSTFGPL